MPSSHLVRTRGIGDALVKFCNALLRALFRGVIKLHVEQHVGERVALFDPGLFAVIPVDWVLDDRLLAHCGKRYCAQ